MAGSGSYVTDSEDVGVGASEIFYNASTDTFVTKTDETVNVATKIKCTADGTEVNF